MAEVKEISQEELAKEWLLITLDRFKKAIGRSGITSDRHILFDSLIGEIKKGGDGIVQSALVQFKMYGRFVDMGVGRGVPLGSAAAKANFSRYRYAENSGKFKRGQLKHYGRTPKKWYGKTLTGQVIKLGELLQMHYGINSLQVMEGKLGDVKVEI